MVREVACGATWIANAGGRTRSGFAEDVGEARDEARRVAASLSVQAHTSRRIGF
jgi:hypothetical protein